MGGLGEASPESFQNWYWGVLQLALIRFFPVLTFVSLVLTCVHNQISSSPWVTALKTPHCPFCFDLAGRIDMVWALRSITSFFPGRFHRFIVPTLRRHFDSFLFGFRNEDSSSRACIDKALDGWRFISRFKRIHSARNTGRDNVLRIWTEGDRRCHVYYSRNT